MRRSAGGDNRAAIWATRELRDEVSELARDGTISGIYFRWFHQSSNDALLIDLLRDAERQRSLLGVAVLVLACIVGVVCWQNRRTRAARRFCQQTTPTIHASTRTATPNSDLCRSASRKRSISSASLLDWWNQRK